MVYNDDIMINYLFCKILNNNLHISFENWKKKL